MAVLSLGGCGDEAPPCATGAGAPGAFTLALDGLCVRDATLRQRVAGVWRGEAEAPGLLVEDAAHGGLRVTLQGTAPAEGLELTLPGLDVDVMLQQGYQSWGFSGTVWIPGAVPLDPDGVAAMTAARTGDPVDEIAGVSFHSIVLRKGDSGPVLVVGALASEHAVTGLAATRNAGETRLSIVYGPGREALPVQGGEVASEPIYLVTAATPEEGLARLTTELQATHAPRGFTPRRPPGGWFSWNYFFDRVDAAAIRAQLPIMQARLLPAGLPLVELDDGWQVGWGDWQDNAKFPGGLPALAAEITGRGLVAGVWFAPFLVDVTSQAAGSPPSWFVQGPDGRPLVHTITGNPRAFHVLDGTNPEAMALVTDEVRRLAAGGFTFFKLDFLYAGAIAGRRSQPVTGVEALRAGLALVRAAAGPDAILNGCGAPIMPMLGLVDSLRVGADTIFDGYPMNFTFVASAARSLGARAHLFPLVWPDADQAQVRVPLSADEARVSAASAALAGAPYALGDDLANLDPARLDLALDPMLVDLAGAAVPATPVGLMGSPAETIAKNPLIESVGSTSGLATPPPATFHATGKSGARYVVTFDWTGARTVTITPMR